MGVCLVNVGHTQKLSLYADDLIFYISKEFGKISGYKINTSKSTIFPINDQAQHLNLKLQQKL